jgi:hypothetical protein
MSIEHAIWTVGLSPKRLEPTALPSEKVLHEMILESPEIISDELMLIGTEVRTPHGGFIDLLGIDPAGTLVIIELKRDKTPRDVVAQALDYASWVKKLRIEDVRQIYANFHKDQDLQDDFRQRFSISLDPDAVGASHQIVIAAAALDEASERIMDYLTESGFPINVVYFQVFKSAKDLLLSRAWLRDPVEIQSAAASAAGRAANSAPWNGEFYVSFGVGESRSWSDAVKHGYIAAGGGAWYSRTLDLLEVGSRVWVNIPGTGYVGVGEVTGARQQASEFEVSTPQGSKSILKAVPYGELLADEADDPELAEYFIPVKWLQTVREEDAIWETGWFGNQNSVARPTADSWSATITGLKKHFPNWDK